jgi:hypothetical protein
MVLAEIREENRDDYRIPADEIFGRRLSSGNSDAREYLHVKQLDLLFCYKRQLFTRQADELKAQRVPVVHVWNCARIEKEFRTQAQYENQFRWLGYAAMDFTFRQEQVQSGLACNAHGGKNYFYRGFKNKPMFVGDRMKWRLPSINPEICEQEKMLLAGDNTHPVERLAAIIEPMTYEDSHLFMQVELTRSFATAEAPNYSWAKMRPGSNEFVDRDRFAAIAFRALLQFTAFATLAAFSCYTGVELPTPGNGKVSTIEDQMGLFNANAVVERLSFSEARKTVIKPHPTDGTLLVDPAGRQYSEAEQLERGRRFEFWAAKVGCAPLAKGPLNNEFTNLINSILGMVMRPLLMDKKMANGTNVLNLFPSSMREQAILTTSTARVERRPDPSKVTGQLVEMQGSAVRDAFWTLGEAIEYTQDKCIGNSLNNTIAGQLGDEVH